jgi:DNA mismatch repair ATPase MutS
MKSLKKKDSNRNPGNEKVSLNQTKNTVESHSSRLEQVEYRISGLEDKIDMKEKRILRQRTQEL